MTSRSTASRLLVIIAAALAFAGVAFNGLLGYRDINSVVASFHESRQDADYPRAAWV